MATTQKQASQTRTIYFEVEGDLYTPYLNTSRGNLIQQYDDDGNFYPNITPTDPVRVVFTATSALATGTVIPDAISFRIGGVLLAFDTAGNCTTQGAENYFRKDGKDLLVIGNIAQYLGFVNSDLEAEAKVNDTTIYAHLPAEISKYSAGLKKKVSIAPADDKNFTLTSQDDTVKLKAGVLQKSGWIYNNSNFYYAWEITDASEATGWKYVKIGSGANGTLEIAASEIDTFADVRCTVYFKPKQSAPINGPVLGDTISDAAIISGGADPYIIGTDCVGVNDASDPLDMIITAKINKTGTGAEEDADALKFTNRMPDTAYLLFEPTVVIRGQTASAGPTTWLSGVLVDPAGITTRNITPANGKYKVLKTDVSGAQGGHTIVFTGKLTL